MGLTIVSALLYRSTNYQYGLDVQGGVRFTFRMDLSKLTQDQKGRVEEIRRNLVRILTSRVAKSIGVVEGNVQAKGTDQFVVELPGTTDIDAARKTLQTSASIKFYWAKNVTTERAGFRRYSEDQQVTEDGSPEVNFRLTRDATKVFKPGDPEYEKMIEGWELILQGDDLKRATGQQNGNKWIPLMEFSSEGSKKIEAWSRKVMNQGEKIAAVMDGVVLSIAPLRDGTILTTNAVIEGDFTPEYVRTLTNLWNSGALPVDLEELSSQKVDPTIGKQALNQILTAGVVAFAFISLFLIIYYVFPGVVALVALLLYILFTLTVLKMLGATFSLAAIAGVVLSVGMAVDANILVFERVKEEIGEGRPLTSAIELGFRRALPAIVDSNACTILTSLVLAQFGTGPVKGFASTLIIGVLISLFTAVTVTRSLLMFLVGTGIGKDKKWYGLNRAWFGEKLEKGADAKPLQIVNNAKRFFIISALPIVPGIIFIAMGGLKPNVEFQGGYEAVYALKDNSTTSASIQKNLEENGIKGGNVKLATADSGRIAYVTVPPIKEFESGGGRQFKDQAERAKALRTKVAQAAGFTEADTREFTDIGPAVQAETVTNAVKGVIYSTILIIVYLGFRFGLSLGLGFVVGLRFGASALGALIHDILVVVGLAAVGGYFLGWEISALFLTAMLTMIGFSTHDTIVIFDRIRENLRKPKRGEDFENLVNRSITQSFARSINTSMTVIVSLAILIFIGSATPDLKLFNAAMLVGVISGTYSSIYNAAPILYLWDRAIGRKKGEKHTLVHLASEELARARAAATAAAAHGGTPAQAPGDPSQSYGSIKRKSGVDKKGTVELDD
ncbi:MAG: protein translocase subunit SecD [Chthonomonadaceae bacterium]|nr:protein translocase subunit SecD [Chthonomonadaceae bacterium]